MDKKIGFFKRAKMAITNFDAYKKFATEGTGTAIKYFFQIVIIFSILVTISVVYAFSTVVNSGVKYIKSEMPDFKFENNELSLESEEALKLEGTAISGLLIIDTTINSDETQAYLDEMDKHSNSILLLKDKLIVKPNETSGHITYDYKSLAESSNIGNFTKQDLVNYLEDSGVAKIYVAVYLIMLFYLFITYVLVTLLDVVLLSVLAFLTCRLYRVDIKYKGCFNMAVHALTLPILLNIIYIFANTLTGFKIEYFQVMYNVISYIYIIVAVLLIKSDLDKKGMDLIKVQEEIKKTEIDEHEEKEQSEEKKEDEKNEKDKDKGTTPEPNAEQA